MSQRSERRGLARGLSALLADGGAEAAAAAGPAPNRIPIDLLHPNPDQPRRQFTEAALDELAQSLKAHGVLQPLLARPHPTRADAYQIVAGERRWRAAQRAGLHDLPVVVLELTDTQVFEFALIENIQRTDLNPIEEATAYRRLIAEFGHTQERLAETVGKSRSHVANTLRLLSLPEPVRALVAEGRLSAGHARAMITASDPEALANRAVAQGLSVRQVEQLARAATPQPRPTRPVRDADTTALEQGLAAQLRMSVRIAHNPDNSGGEIRIRYKTLEQLDDLCRLLGG